MGEMKRLLEEYFKSWDIVLPDEDVSGRRPGTISKAGWAIRYIFGKDDGREFIEFYAIHRMTNDRHRRIYEDGKILDLEAVCSMYSFDPRIPGDREQKERINRENNNRIYGDLEKKGLGIMTVNTYLSLNDVDSGKER